MIEPLEAGTTEFALVERCLLKDQQACAELYLRHAPKALGLAYNLVGDRCAAQDVTQEAFARSFRSLDRLREGVSFSTWVLQNLIWVARSHLKREAARRWLPLSRAFVQPSEVDYLETRIVLEEALRALPQKQREVLCLRYQLGYTVAETAELLRCRTGTVKSRSARALKRMSAALGPQTLLSADGAARKEVHRGTIGY